MLSPVLLVIFDFNVRTRDKHPVPAIRKHRITLCSSWRQRRAMIQSEPPATFSTSGNAFTQANGPTARRRLRQQQQQQLPVRTSPSSRPYLIGALRTSDDRATAAAVAADSRASCDVGGLKSHLGLRGDVPDFEMPGPNLRCRVAVVPVSSSWPPVGAFLRGCLWLQCCSVRQRPRIPIGHRSAARQRRNARPAFFPRLAAELRTRRSAAAAATAAAAPSATDCRSRARQRSFDQSDRIVSSLDRMTPLKRARARAR
jgi:hypothetical protein